MATERFYPATLENQKKIIGMIEKFTPKYLGPMITAYRKNEGDTVKLNWIDPKNVLIDGVSFCSWGKTVIVKKQGGIPESPEDGIVVATVQVRDLYSENPLVDTQTNPSEWTYMAFPYDTNGNWYGDSHNVFVNFLVYGIDINEADPDEATCVSYTNDATGKAPAHMNFGITNNETTTAAPPEGWFDFGSWKDAFFMPRPCMLKNDGTVDYYLDPNDYTKKADGTESDVRNLDYEGNAMMEFPKAFIRAYKVGDVVSIRISNIKIDDHYECFSCLKADGTYSDFFYMPIYEGQVINGKMRSMSTPTTKAFAVNITQTAQYTAAKANGDSLEYNGWANTTFADEEHIKALAVLVFRRLNLSDAVQADTGSGDYGANNCGLGDLKGMFWGQNNSRKSDLNMKFFGMENWLGYRWRRVLGINLGEGYWLAKMTRTRADGTTIDDFLTDTSLANYKNNYNNFDAAVDSMSYSGAYITAMYGFTEAEGQRKMSCIFTPKTAVGGSTSTKYCDAVWTSSGLYGVLFCGAANHGAAAGLFAVLATYAPSTSSASFGASLSYHKNW